MVAPYVTSKQYVAVFDQAMTYWNKWHKEYISLIPEYKRLMKIKRAKKIVPLNTINVTVLNDFPKIRFLKIQDWETAEDYLLELTYSEMKRLIIKLEDYEYNHARRNLKVWIADTKLQLNPKHRRKSYVGVMGPDYSKSSTPFPKSRHHISIHET